MKPARFLWVLMAIPLILSCQDDWTFSADGRYELRFQADTVKMDTVFTGVASVSKTLMIYNPNDRGIRFDAILAGGAYSPFRINMDGEGGTQIAGLEIPAGDSLFCFVSVNILESGSRDIFHASDSIRFVLESGVVQSVMLSAYGLNAVRLKGVRIEHDTTLTATVPYLIYDSLYVAPGAHLTIGKGARLYFHSGAVLDVAGRLTAVGAPDSMIVMRGDRLDDLLPDLKYDLLNGQWGGVIMRESSLENELAYCDIHGGNWGITAYGCGSADTKLSLRSSIIHNVKGSCIEATDCRIDVANCQITNGAKACVDIAGGQSDFTFCTIAAFSLWDVAGQAVLLSDRRGDDAAPLSGAAFRNCIITGRHNNEFEVEVEDSIRADAPYMVSNSLLMVHDTADTRFHDVVFEDIKSKVFGSYNFTDRTVRGYSSIFELDSLSSARGIADSLSAVWPVDLNGIPRPPVGADAGCYQYKP